MNAINVVEIGVAGGGSLEMWSQFFPLATIVGIDVNPTCKSSAGHRKIVEIGSQSDPVFLDFIVTKYPPSVVIDDGSHQADHIRFTFEVMFPHMNPSGCYIIEDLHFHVLADVAEKNIQMGAKAPHDFIS